MCVCVLLLLLLLLVVVVVVVVFVCLFVGGRVKLFSYYYTNTSRAPHLKINPKRFTMATTALFSASEQTHCFSREGC